MPQQLAPDRSLQLLTAEYEWVAGLIRCYREVELKAIGQEATP